MTKEKEYKLTIKQEAFARAYVETGNASEAYRRAYNAENMQQITATKWLGLADGIITAAALAFIGLI